MIDGILKLPRLKITRKIITPKDASFGFNLNQSMDCDVYAQVKILMIDNYFPPNSSPKGSLPLKKNSK